MVSYPSSAKVTSTGKFAILQDPALKAPPITLPTSKQESSAATTNPKFGSDALNVARKTDRVLLEEPGMTNFALWGATAHFGENKPEISEPTSQTSKPETPDGSPEDAKVVPPNTVEGGPDDAKVVPPSTVEVAKKETESTAEVNESSAPPKAEIAAEPHQDIPKALDIVESVQVAANVESVQVAAAPVEAKQEESSKSVLILISTQSLDRQVVSNQQNAMTILDANKIAYTTLDGSDPSFKDRRNELFAISGIRAKYPQFFIVDGDKSTFWGSWDDFQTSNESGTLASDLGAVGTVAPAGPKMEPSTAPAVAGGKTPDLEPEIVATEIRTSVASRSLEEKFPQVLKNEEGSDGWGHGGPEAMDSTKAKETRKDVVEDALTTQTTQPEPEEIRVVVVDQKTEAVLGEAEQAIPATQPEPHPTEATINDQMEVASDEVEQTNQTTQPEGRRDIVVDQQTNDEPGVKKNDPQKEDDYKPRSREIDDSKTETKKNLETDLTVYGATSFVARHVLMYLIQASMHLDETIKITLAGRNESKLSEILDELSKTMKNLKQVSNATDNIGAEFDVVVAEASDNAALRSMASRTEVVLNCAGPFRKYSSGVVAACAELGTDYVDISGEVHWAADMRDKYGSLAKASGARIVPFCGFDAVPSDLAVFNAVRVLRETTHSDCNIERAATWHSSFGLINGGTLETLLDCPLDLGRNLLQPVPFLMNDPLALVAPQTRQSPSMKAVRKRLALTEWHNQLPFFHSFLKGAFSAPFMMAPLNAKVVHASAVSMNYGPKFVYFERFLPVGFKGSIQLQTLTIIPVMITQIAVLIGMFILKLPVVGPILVDTFMPAGTGASDMVCQSGYAEVYAEVETSANPNTKKLSKANCFIKFEGDPGNWVTSQCVCEAALSLLYNRDELPLNSADGFGTPAQIMGAALTKRLTESKVRKVELVTHVRKSTEKHEWKMFP